MEFCLCAAPLGAPAAAQLMDFLISCGCRKIISTGSCGVLTNLAENEFLIPVKALRDEGTSYHYLPASRSIELDKKYPGCYRADFSCAENSVPGVYYMDNGWLLPGNAGYGEVSQGGRMHNGRDGVRRIGCLRPEARCFFRADPLYGRFSCECSGTR